MLRLSTSRQLLSCASRRQLQAALCPLSRGASSGSEQPSYTERMAKTGRPVAPHVDIYAFPPAALTSIANRVTGVGLYVGKETSPKGCLTLRRILAESELSCVPLRVCVLLCGGVGLRSEEHTSELQSLMRNSY